MTIERTTPDGTSILIAQLDAVRASAIALVMTIDAVSSALTTREIATSTARPETTSTGCAHPVDARTPSPAMGDPDRYICGACRTVVGAERET